MRGKTIAIILGVLVVVGGAIAWKPLSTLYQALHVSLPEYPAAQAPAPIPQNLTTEQRKWYYHADQGTRTFGIPYEWFVALEQPTLISDGLFSDAAYLDRYGFIPDTMSTNKPPLPIGLAQGGPMAMVSGEPWLNPRSKTQMTGIGLTCSACHTGRFTYRNKSVIVDGGSALTDLFKLKQAFGAALGWTALLPWRFTQFADRVLGPDAGADERAALKAQLKQVIQQYKDVNELETKAGGTYEGYGRLDALNRIGNQAFSLDLNNPKNYAAHSAPVHYPRIWDSPWFSWVQYNGSIEQPMVRNAGEALGVSAEINLTNAKKDLFASSVQIKNLWEMEKMLAGPKQPTAENKFTGLTSPTWPTDILPPHDQKLADQGAALYKVRCEPCHLPPVKSDEFWKSKRWLEPNKYGERVLDLEQIPIAHIGTDPSQAAGMKDRKVETPASLGIGTDEFGPALGVLVTKTVNYWYDQQKPPLSKEEKDRMDGNRANGIRAPLEYKVRPLNGVWATPPYLHNGSVPNVYALLSPVSERPTTFYLGNREYDPVNLGYVTDPLTNGFEFDTSKPGNSNKGHEFSKEFDPKKEVTGLIGPYLTPDERKALIEYLKTL
jgi:mono/diheme cytochrome c family protein